MKRLSRQIANDSAEEDEGDSRASSSTLMPMKMHTGSSVFLSGFRVNFRAHAQDCLVNHGLKFVRRQVGKFLAYLGPGQVKDAPFDGLLDELRQVAFLETTLRKKAAQGDVGLLGSCIAMPSGS